MNAYSPVLMTSTMHRDILFYIYFLNVQEQVRTEQTDVNQQREQLYLKLQALTNQGIIVSLSMQPPPVSPNQQTQNQSSPDGVVHPLSHSESVRSNKRSDSMKWKQHTPPSVTSSSTLPINLISATNQQKVYKITKYIKSISILLFHYFHIFLCKILSRWLPKFK